MTDVSAFESDGASRPQEPAATLLAMNLERLEPVPALLDRMSAELMGSFDFRRPIRVSRAPGRLDVMGGIADYTGSLVCEMPLGMGTAVALQERGDRQVSLFSFNLLDEHVPFQFGMSLDALAKTSANELRRELSQPGRQWAAYVIGCLFILHEKGYVDLADPRHRGLNLAIHSTVPIGGGVSSSAALEVAVMTGLVEHFRERGEGWPLGRGRKIQGSGGQAPGGASGFEALTSVKPLHLAALCQEVENRIVGAPCGIMDQVTCLLGRPGELLRLLCQPHELQPPLPLPEGVKVVGVFTGVRHSVSGGAYGRTRAAAFMGRRIILEHMRRLGEEAGLTMTGDPMRGYLANLPPEDYKALFRPILPEETTGREFLDSYGSHDDAATTITPDETYLIQRACDHHVIEAQRVRRFAGFLEDLARATASPEGEAVPIPPQHPAPGATASPEREAVPIPPQHPRPVSNSTRGPASSDDDDRLRTRALRSAGHLMYASHLSYTEHAGLGHPAADVLVDLVKRYEPAGLYGARITGGGAGGTVAILMDATARADDALAAILHAYEQATGHRPTLLAATSPGAWHVGTELIG